MGLPHTSQQHPHSLQGTTSLFMPNMGLGGFFN